MKFWEIQRFSQQVLVVDHSNQKEWFSEELQIYINELKLFLQCKHDKKLIVILCKNNISSIIGYLAGLQLKDAVMLVDASLNLKHVNSLIEAYKPDFIFSPINFQLEKAYRIVYQIFEYYLYQLVYTKDCQIKIYSELALLLPTSGSTGSPKFVRLSYCNLNENAKSIASYLQLSKEERAITSLPMHYSYGLSVINSHLLVGASLLLTQESVVDKKFWEFSTKCSATSIAGVPYTYEMFKRIQLEKIAPPSLATITQAGGRLNLMLAKHFYHLAKIKGWKFYIMYGQTEATARISYLSIENMERKLTSVGKVIPGGRIEINKESNELIYFGKNVMLGYACDRLDLAKKDINRGILNTGDIAEKDKDGFIYIKGRNKRFIKLHGVRINLDSIEENLKNSFGNNVFCEGTDSSLHVFTGLNNDPKIIKQFLFEKFKVHHTLVIVHKLSEIPLNRNNKVDYKKLKEMTSI